MRLINADDYSGKCICYNRYCGPQKLIRVDDVPTAFDVDNVIAELEKERDNCYEQMKKIEEKREDETDHFDGHIFDEYHNQGIGLNKAIEIIKKYISVNCINCKYCNQAAYHDGKWYCSHPDSKIEKAADIETCFEKRE